MQRSVTATEARVHSASSSNASPRIRTRSSRSGEACPSSSSSRSPSTSGSKVANVLHRCQRTGLISKASRDIVLEAVFDLPIEFENDSARLHCRALAVAGELLPPAAYDAHYLAFARALDVELWTNDSRLARFVGDRGPKVRVLGEE